MKQRIPTQVANTCEIQEETNNPQYNYIKTIIKLQTLLRVASIKDYQNKPRKVHYVYKRETKKGVGINHGTRTQMGYSSILS